MSTPIKANYRSKYGKSENSVLRSFFPNNCVVGFKFELLQCSTVVKVQVWGLFRPVGFNMLFKFVSIRTTRNITLISLYIQIHVKKQNKKQNLYPLFK